MAVVYHEADGIWHLQAESASYVVRRCANGLVGGLYWGARLEDRCLAPLAPLRDARLPAPGAEKSFEGTDEGLFYAEYPVRGAGDFRPPAFAAVFESGSRVLNLRYAGWRLETGKPALTGLPSLRGEGEQTLVIELRDALNGPDSRGLAVRGEETGLRVELFYTIFEETGAVARSVRVLNDGPSPVTLGRVLSAACDLPPDGADGGWEVLSLTGSWARERMVRRQCLSGGAVVLESLRGISSHEANPFLALASRGTSEEAGRVYALNLVYSGNFLAQASQDAAGCTRLLCGVNPEDFSWRLEPGESFQTPECVLVFSDAGLGGMSRAFHRLYRENLVPKRWAKEARPVLVNNWEATYFDFTAEKLLSIADEAAKLGIELFVLDDGWFGKRDSDNCSLGDWVEDRRKLPDGLASLAHEVNKRGLKFGLWFEPEMVSPDSELYRAHPDWCLHAAGRRRTEIRNQLVLDLCRAEVRDAVVAMVSAVLKAVPVAYVKWDMNRPLTETESPSLPASRKRETSHRYTLGVYDIISRLTSAFPDVLFEGCASGGARFDPGILCYMPQIWTSDNSDAVSRLMIQWGTSLVYPLSTMGAHVSAVPNHQTGRVTPLATRANVALSGVFGYELDLGTFTEEEKESVREQVAFYKAHRNLLQQGDLYRLKSPFAPSGEAAWAVVSADKREAFVLYTRILAQASPPLPVLRLAGLDPALVYRVSSPSFQTRPGLQGETSYTRVDTAPGKAAYSAGGDLLMSAGLRLPRLQGDFASCIWLLQA